jgi:hypothetical protein
MHVHSALGSNDYFIAFIRDVKKKIRFIAIITTVPAFATSLLLPLLLRIVPLTAPSFGIDCLLG